MKIKFTRMTASRHFIDRYNERVLNGSEEKTKGEIEELFEGKELPIIVKAKYHTNNMTNFFLDNINGIDYIIVVNESMQCLITIIDIDYGFNKELNSIITEKTMEEVIEKQLQLEEFEAKIEQENVLLDSEIDKNNEIIDSLQREIDNYKSINNGLKTQKENNILSKSSCVEDLNRVAYKIIYNINYNVDKLSKK